MALRKLERIGVQMTYKNLDPDFLTLDEVSTLLRCSPDTVRRIPRDRLPVYRVGKCNIYLREEVIRYLRSHCLVQCRTIDRIVSEIEQDVLGSPPDGVRERSRRRTP